MLLVWFAVWVIAPAVFWGGLVWALFGLEAGLAVALVAAAVGWFMGALMSVAG